MTSCRVSVGKLAAMGRLTASIAHEVRNPLSAINQAAQLLEEDGSVAQEGQRLLAMIRSNAKRIDRITNIRPDRDFHFFGHNQPSRAARPRQERAVRRYSMLMKESSLGLRFGMPGMPLNSLTMCRLNIAPQNGIGGVSTVCRV